MADVIYCTTLTTLWCCITHFRFNRPPNEYKNCWWPLRYDFNISSIWCIHCCQLIRFSSMTLRSCNKAFSKSRFYVDYIIQSWLITLILPPFIVCVKEECSQEVEHHSRMLLLHAAVHPDSHVGFLLDIFCLMTLYSFEEVFLRNTNQTLSEMTPRERKLLSAVFPIFSHCISFFSHFTLNLQNGLSTS